MHGCILYVRLLACQAPGLTTCTLDLCRQLKTAQRRKGPIKVVNQFLSLYAGLLSKVYIYRIVRHPHIGMHRYQY